MGIAPTSIPLLKKIQDASNIYHDILLAKSKQDREEEAKRKSKAFFLFPSQKR